MGIGAEERQEAYLNSLLEEDEAEQALRDEVLKLVKQEMAQIRDIHTQAVLRGILFLMGHR